MPVVGIPVRQLHQVLGSAGEGVSPDELVDHLHHLGCDVEGYASLQRFKCSRCGAITEITETQTPPVQCGNCGLSFKDHPDMILELGTTEVIRMELLAVRPDLFDPAGLGRALRAYLGADKGLRTYGLDSVAARLEVDPATQTERCPRPAIAAAVVRGLRLDDDLVKVLMKLQENLHWALGRDRKHASIGVYDLALVQGPFRYKAVAPDGLRFVPLGMDPDDRDSAMTPAEILERHPKGVAFARLLEPFELYPLLVDSNDLVLSMPPIINSEQTRVREETSDLFIDVTGTNRHIVNKALVVLTTSLKELQPDCVVQGVEVSYPDGGVLVTPDFTPQEVDLDPDATARLIGVDLDRKDVVALLERMGHQVEDRGDALHVWVPAYRTDILHPRDLMEDTAIAYGYHNISPRLVPTMTVGSPDPAAEAAEAARKVLVGLGYMEAMTLVLTSPSQAFEAMRIEEDQRAVLLDNPISADQTMLRVSLLPGLLETLGFNTHRELPQRLFEVGPVTLLDEEAETGAREHHRLASVFIDARAGAADARALCQALGREFGLDLTVTNGSLGSYLDGRCALVSWNGRPLGHLGEIHPEVLERFGLGHPVAAMELDLDLLSQALPAYVLGQEL